MFIHRNAVLSATVSGARGISFSSFVFSAAMKSEGYRSSGFIARRYVLSVICTFSS